MPSENPTLNPIGLNCSYTQYIVYLLVQKRTAAVKIGYTKNIRQRLRTLQTASADKLYFVGHCEFSSESSARNFEAKLHAEHVAHRRTGEWFSHECIKSLKDYGFTWHWGDYHVPSGRKKKKKNKYPVPIRKAYRECLDSMGLDKPLEKWQGARKSQKILQEKISSMNLGVGIDDSISKMVEYKITIPPPNKIDLRFGSIYMEFLGNKKIDWSVAVDPDGKCSLGYHLKQPSIQQEGFIFKEEDPLAIPYYIKGMHPANFPIEDQIRSISEFDIWRFAQQNNAEANQ